MAAQTPYVPLTRFQISLHVGCTAFPDAIDNRASPSGGRQEFAAGDFQAQHGGRAGHWGLPYGLVKHHVTYQELAIGAPLPRHRLLQTESSLTPSRRPHCMRVGPHIIISNRNSTNREIQKVYNKPFDRGWSKTPVRF